jgi:hypothetical protein
MVQDPEGCVLAPFECQTLEDKIQERLNGKSGEVTIKGEFQQQKSGLMQSGEERLFHDIQERT